MSCNSNNLYDNQLHCAASNIQKFLSGRFRQKLYQFRPISENVFYFFFNIFSLLYFELTYADMLLKNSFPYIDWIILTKKRYKGIQNQHLQVLLQVSKEKQFKACQRKVRGRGSWDFFLAKVFVITKKNLACQDWLQGLSFSKILTTLACETRHLAIGIPGMRPRDWHRVLWSRWLRSWAHAKRKEERERDRERNSSKILAS